MNFIENNNANIGKIGVALQTTSKHTFGEYFNASIWPNNTFVACLVPDGVANFFTQHVCHASCSSTRSKFARLEHHNAFVRQKP